MVQAVEDIEGALDELDGALKQRSHVAGAEYSLADAAWTAVLHELEMAGRDALWEAGKRRNVARHAHALAFPGVSVYCTDDACCPCPCPLCAGGIVA
jgi:glutathione S-transferase